MSLLNHGLALALNGLLGRNAWALDRLSSFQNRVVRFTVGKMQIDLALDAHGRFGASSTGQLTAEDVEISLPIEQLSRLLEGKEAFFGGARLSGAANFAEQLGFVLRHLQWHIEDDLANFLGDIPGRRLAMAASAFSSKLSRINTALISQIRSTSQESSDWGVVSQDCFTSFKADVTATEADSTKLAARISRLSLL